MISRLLIVIATFLVIVSVNALKIEFHSFDNKQQERLFTQLVNDLRCVKCQNQNLAMSEAEIARDMRDKVYEIVKKGGTREDVIKYMTDRYGEFVLYKPRFEVKTILLWVGPAVLLLLSLFFLLKLIKKQQEEPIESLSTQDRESVRKLLKSKKSN